MGLCATMFIKIMMRRTIMIHWGVTECIWGRFT
jgi:hypothetical protein